MMIRLHRDERGQSLVIVLSLITIMFLLGSSLAVHASVALRSTRATEGQADAFYAADAATELGIWWQRNGKAGNPPAQTINGVTTSTTITSVGGGGGSCTGDPRPVWLTGFENGALIRMNGTANSLLGGFAFVNGGGSFGITDVVASPARTGNFALRIAPNAGQWTYAYHDTSSVNVGPTTVVHLAVRLGALPTTDASVFSLTPSGSTGLPHAQLNLMYRVGTGRWALGLGTSATIDIIQESTVTAALNTWYSFDIRFPTTSSHIRLGEWYIDGVAQTSVTATDNPAFTASNPRAVFGSSGTPVAVRPAYTAYYDDVLISTTSADFPLGPLNVVPLLPNAMGTHNTPANYQNNDSTAINATTWQRIDEQPMTVLTDYIKQITAGGGSYAEIAFQDTAETCIRGASILAGLHAASTSADNAAINTVANGVNDTVWSGDPSNTTLFYLHGMVSQNTITPGVGPWTQAVINGTVARFGFATDVNPNPYLDGIILETAHKPLTGGPATITIVGTGGGSTITTDYLDAGAGIPTLNTWNTTQ